MDLTAITLSITLIAASLFVGVIAAMLGVIQRVLNQLDFVTFTEVMQGIIQSGRSSLVIWSLLLVPILFAGFSLFLLQTEGKDLAFNWLTAGLLLFIIGPILVSRFGNEPYYDEVMGWRRDQAVSDWQRKRNRWFWLNVIRFSFGVLACIAMAVALTLSSPAW